MWVYNGCLYVHVCPFVFPYICIHGSARTQVLVCFFCSLLYTHTHALMSMCISTIQEMEKERRRDNARTAHLAYQQQAQRWNRRKESEKKVWKTENAERHKQSAEERAQREVERRHEGKDILSGIYQQFQHRRQNYHRNHKEKRRAQHSKDTGHRNRLQPTHSKGKHTAYQRNKTTERKDQQQKNNHHQNANGDEAKLKFTKHVSGGAGKAKREVAKEKPPNRPPLDPMVGPHIRKISSVR